MFSVKSVKTFNPEKASGVQIPLPGHSELPILHVIDVSCTFTFKISQNKRMIGS